MDAVWREENRYKGVQVTTQKDRHPVHFSAYQRLRTTLGLDEDDILDVYVVILPQHERGWIKNCHTPSCFWKGFKAKPEEKKILHNLNFYILKPPDNFALR